MHYSSEIASKALLLAPEGIPYDGPGCFCAMCRRPIKAGDLARDEQVIPKTFTDHPHVLLSGVDKLYVCGFCSATIPQDRNRYLQRSVITPNGLYSLNTDAARAWFWLTPPEPPYVVVVSHSTLGVFHYFWRTPVTLDNRLVWMNWDGAIHQVNRRKVIDAASHAQSLTEAANAGRKKSLIKGVFRQVNRQGLIARFTDHGRFQPEIIAVAQTDPQLRQSLDLLAALNPGELLAVSAFLKAVPAEPLAPPLVAGMPDRSRAFEAEAVVS